MSLHPRRRVDNLVDVLRLRNLDMLGRLIDLQDHKHVHNSADERHGRDFHRLRHCLNLRTPVKEVSSSPTSGHSRRPLPCSPGEDLGFFAGCCLARGNTEVASLPAPGRSRGPAGTGLNVDPCSSPGAGGMRVLRGNTEVASSPASGSSRRPQPCSGDAVIGGIRTSTLCSTVRARRRSCGMTCLPASAAMSKVCFTMRSPNSSFAVAVPRLHMSSPPGGGRPQGFVLFTCRATHWKLYPHQRRRRHLIGRTSEDATSTKKVGTAPSPLSWHGTPTNVRC